LSAAVRRSFASLQVPNYRLYFGGQIVSLAGNWMQIVAELWLILTLTDSGVAVGIATALQFSGIMLFGALGGSLVDRFDKRKLLIVSQTAMAVPALALFGLALSGAVEVWMVLALIGLRGLVLSVDNPARQAFVIEIVGPDRVVNAVGLNSVLIHSARITGPALAGLLIALVGVEPCFLLNALTFAAMLVALLRMRPDELQRAPRRTGGRGVRDALAYVARTPELRVPLALMAVLGTLGFNFQVILPLLARFSFGGSVYAYTELMVAMGVGAIAGALAIGAFERTGPRVIAGAALVFGLASLATAASPTLPLAMVALVALGAASVTFAAAINSGIQLVAAPEMRGRVMALYSIVFLGSTPIGGPLSGWIAETVSPRASLVLAGVAALAVALAASVAMGEGAFRRRPDAIRRRERDSGAPTSRSRRGRGSRGARRRPSPASSPAAMRSAPSRSGPRPELVAAASRRLRAHAARDPSRRR
jgi:MFS family permease